MPLKLGKNEGAQRFVSDVRGDAARFAESNLADADVGLDFEEFLAMQPEQILKARPMEEIRGWFDQAAGPDQRLSITEFFHFSLSKASENAGATALRDCFRRWDTDRSGYLDAVEFANAVHDKANSWTRDDANLVAALYAAHVAFFSVGSTTLCEAVGLNEVEFLDLFIPANPFSGAEPADKYTQLGLRLAAPHRSLVSGRALERGRRRAVKHGGRAAAEARAGSRAAPGEPGQGEGHHGSSSTR